MSVVSEIQVVDEIPDSMKRLALYIVRTFYGDEYAIIMDYIKRNVCIKEDTLKDITKFEPKFLRQILIALKLDKLIKERQAVDTRPEGKQAKINYYFVNYRALLNVTKYKLDHMRQKLEMKEKEGTQRASFKCSGCAQTYDAMEMDRLFDPMSGELKCWRCRHTVEEDSSVGPTDSTRSVLARFNEQLTGLFSLLQQLDGVQLAAHLLEPTLADAVADREGQGDAANGGGGGQGHMPALGASKTGMMRYRQEVTLNIESETSGAQTSVEHKKEQPVWLTQNAGLGNESALAAASLPSSSTNIIIKTESDEPTAAFASSPKLGSPTQPTIRLHSDDLQADQPPDAKRIKLEPGDEDQLSSAGGGGKTDDSDDDNEFQDVTDTTLTVNGKTMTLAEVMHDPALVDQMTDDEKQTYEQLCQEAIDTMGY